MTEQVPPRGPEELVDQPSSAVHEAEVNEPGPETRSEPLRTGVAPVDDMLAEVDGLDDLPVDQHLAVFERAHGVLRAALDAEPGDPA
jgi:hypothetical protein